MAMFTYILLALVAPVFVCATCYNPGPSFPPVHRLLDQTDFEQLRTTLHRVISDILQEPDGWTTNTTSFAVQVTSVNETLWDYFYTAPILGEYKDSDPTPVTGDTAFRIASISKSFTVYAALLENKINLDDSVAQYIPELIEQRQINSTLVNVDWDQVTIWSLASQLSGISREADSIRLPDPVAKGFPPIPTEDDLRCFKNTTDRACNTSEVIAMAAQRPKVFEVNDRSTYSNAAFALLGIILERATGKNYSEIISSSILEPLGMNHTSTAKPKDSMGVIPYGANDWGQELGAENSSGGLYSTANDLSEYIRSILSSKLLPIATVNAWMKPHSWSHGVNSAYGMPWEMFRTTKLTSGGRAIDIITKGGDLTGYASLIAMIPEFGVGITILVAGNPQAQYDLRERLIANLVPAIEELLRCKVRARYEGSYISLFGDSSLTLVVDDMGQGIRVVGWRSNGTDFLSVYGDLKRMGESAGNWQARLIPTGIYASDLAIENWRLTAVPEKLAKNEARIFDDFCIRDVDALMYGGVSLELFSFSEIPYAGDLVFLPALLAMLVKWPAGRDSIGNIDFKELSEVTTRLKFSSSGNQVPMVG
ncbi:hypothetical protein OIDMADRAFT_22431 [Oidiodendron maius Zn]|uniref:Uncharacterized protein n=1 Tax=Oidiodendron maius (strain Zn) TaxID=913774 RepID=A0A0C3HZA1_OIDMZ|nr:hypothetical protein OIDMADRAFT_22431 [Oidiodendron maius Zn]